MPQEPDVSGVGGETPHRIAIFDTSLRDGEQAPEDLTVDPRVRLSARADAAARIGAPTSPAYAF